MRTGFIVWLGLLIAAFAILCGILLGNRADPYTPQSLARAAEIEQRAEQRAAEAPAWLGVKVALALSSGAVGLVLLYRWADRRMRVIYPADSGAMPAVLLRPGETLADAGALAAPLQVTASGPSYPQLPPGDIPQLQAAANQGAAYTRTMRAWSTHTPAQREEQRALPMPGLDRSAYPRVEVLTGDVGHIYRLLEESNGEGQ